MIICNWKMFGDTALVEKYIERVSPQKDLIICPPFPLLHALRHFMLGAQNCHHAENGAYTGEVSVPMLAEMG